MSQFVNFFFFWSLWIHKYNNDLQWWLRLAWHVSFVAVTIIGSETNYLLIFHLSLILIIYWGNFTGIKRIILAEKNDFHYYEQNFFSLHRLLCWIGYVNRLTLVVYMKSKLPYPNSSSLLPRHNHWCCSHDSYLQCLAFNYIEHSWIYIVHSLIFLQFLRLECVYYIHLTNAK